MSDPLVISPDFTVIATRNQRVNVLSGRVVVSYSPDGSRSTQLEAGDNYGVIAGDSLYASSENAARVEVTERDESEATPPETTNTTPQPGEGATTPAPAVAAVYSAHKTRRVLEDTAALKTYILKLGEKVEDPWLIQCIAEVETAEASTTEISFAGPVNNPGIESVDGAWDARGSLIYGDLSEA